MYFIYSSFSSNGNFEDMQDAGSLHEFLVNLHDEYGPLASFWWGTNLVVSLASPEMFDEVKALFDRPSTVYIIFYKSFSCLHIVCLIYIQKHLKCLAAF